MNTGIQRGLHDLTRDASYAARQLRRNPLFVLTSVLTLAIAIGANTTVFTLANALLFSDPVGVKNPDRLVDIGVSVNGSGFGSGSYPNYVDISRYASSFEGVYAHPRFPTAMTLRSVDNSAVERVFASQVTTNYFSVLGALPAAG